MQKLKTIIVENDPKSLSLLLSLISDYCPELDVTATVTNIQDAVKQILHQQPGLVFLDMELDDGAGLDVLNQIPVKNFKTIIISGFSEYAINAYQFEVTHYLLKPVSIRDLRIAIDRVLPSENKIENTNKKNRKNYL
ncbi:MAG: response regulator [Bacteroidales bacterium]|nr:response regulator [Bacteroidales bacterium]